METNYRDTVSKIVGWGHWFTFYNVLIALVAGVYYAASGGWPSGLLDNLFLVVFMVGHFSLMLFSGFILFLFPVAFVLPFWRTYRTISILTATLAQSLLLLDCVFYNRLGTHSNPILYELFYNAGPEQMGVSWWKAAIVIIALLLIEIALANWISRWRKSRSRQRFGSRLAQLFFACFFIYNFAFAGADVMGREGIIRQQEFFPLAFPLTAKTTLKKWGIEGSNQLPEDTLNVRFYYPKAPIKAQAVIKPNIVMLVVSSLREDMLNPTNMPYTTALARQSLWASRYYSSGQDHETAMFGLLYGIPATYTKAAAYSQQPPALTQWLKQQGYSLSLFSSRAPTSQHPIYQDISKSYVPEQRVNAAIADTATLHHWQQDYQQNQGKPNFYLINLMGVEQYATPPGFNNLFQPDLEGVLLLGQETESATDALLNRYRNAVLHTDQLINYVIEQIDLSNTLLIITSDQGRFFKRPNQSSMTSFHPSRIQVPFLMAGAGIEPKVTSGLASHYDVAATLIQHLSQGKAELANFSSGVDLQQRNSRPEWLLLGNRSKFALVEDDRLTIVDKFISYQIYSNLMSPQTQQQLRVSPMLQAVKEMHRFSRK